MERNPNQPTWCNSLAFFLLVLAQSERFAREGRVPVTPETQEIPITDIPGLPPLQPRDLPSMYLFAETYDWYSYHDNRNGKADLVLVNSFYDLEKQAMDGVRKEVIGTPGVQVSRLPAGVGMNCCIISVSYYNNFVQEQHWQVN